MPHKKTTKVGAVLLLSVASAFVLTACGAPESPPASEATKTAAPEPAPSNSGPTPEASGADPADITRSPESRDYCGVVGELRQRADTMATLSETDQISVIGANLDYLAGAMEILQQQDADRAEAWREAATSYSAASDFYAVSGEQLANDDFLVLLAQAVAASDSAYGQTRDRALAECGTDVAPLITPER